jgi:hypothetical protein
VYDCIQVRSGWDDVRLLKDLLVVPETLPVASRYTIVNGLIYLASGLVFVIWPAAVQRVFLDSDFVGHEAGLVRVLGLTIAIIGWLYVFGGRSGGRQLVAATVIDRVLFVPIVLVPLALAGIFPHVLIAFAVLDPALALIGWLILSRSE